jgi:DNA-binding response OmpR family regulator
MDTDSTRERAGDDAATVLVVDDEPGLVEVYSHSLSTEYAVRTATGGEEALAAVDEAVDIVFLDRRMPDLPGDDVLERIRDRGLNARVVMVTAVQPDFDIVEMGFDAYLVKPVVSEDLLDTAERMLTRDDYADSVQELYALAEKRATLEAEKHDHELEHSSEFESLLAEMDRAQAHADDDLESIADGGFEEAFADISS